MTVTVIGGPISRRLNEGFSQEQMTQSTATAAQALSLFTDVSLLGGGTATGVERNVYSLASGIEGQEKFVALIATGEGAVSFQGATATDLWVLNATDGMVFSRYVKGTWRALAWSETKEVFSQSTATAFQNLHPAISVSFLGGGTATGFGRNQYLLPDGAAGAEKVIRLAATGEAKLIWDDATATGQVTFSGVFDVAHLRFSLGFGSRPARWWIVSLTGATFATTT